MCDGAPDTQGGLPPRMSVARPNVAVASSSGSVVDMHLGHAWQVLVFGPGDDGVLSLLEARRAPEPGGGGARWKALSEMLRDCFAVVVSGAGRKPIEVLAGNGIAVIVSESSIKDALSKLYLAQMSAR